MIQVAHMLLNELGNFYLPTTFAPAVTHVAGRPVEWPLGLRHALIDAAALTALNRLVTGPVTSWDTVESAELALRAFILHERADCLLPGVLVTYRHGTTQSLHTVRYAFPEEPDALTPVIREVGLHNRPVFTEWLSVRDQRILDRNSFWSGREEQFFSSDKSVVWEAFAEYATTDRFQPALVATPTAIGAPSYFGVGPARRLEAERLKESSLDPGSRFYENIDEAWRDRLRVYQHAGLDIRIGPLVSTVLSRASQRSEIPEVVLELRQKFSRAGHKLWTMLEELQRETDPKRLLQTCEKVERASRAIIPAAFPQSARPIRIAFDIVTNLDSLLGPLKVILDHLLERDVSMQHASALDAAKLLAKEIRRGGTDVVGPLQRHLSQSELQHLGLPAA